MNGIDNSITISAREIISMIETIVITLGITMIITFQFLRLREYKRLFNQLFASFGFIDDKKLSKQEIIDKIISKTQQSDRYSDDKIFDRFSRFVNENQINSRVFIHFTRNKLVADLIIDQGFKFTDSFFKTTQEVSLDKTDLLYKLQLYREYGNYLVIISIPKDMFDYNPININLNTNFLVIELGLCNQVPGEDLNYLLPSIFVNGYFDFEKDIIVRNKKFQKGFDSNVYKDRIEKELLKKTTLPNKGSTKIGV